ncbi:MAG TPA: tripartite tricarboxylate transporter substrate binding protein, partial [Burkholderiales bacterium]|nr:tripartite tricarboxylate transporter substrate binding protein [Burkholderiales bacterium]
MRDDFVQRAIAITAAALCLVGAACAWGQAPYPSKPVRLIVPWPPGGGADVLSRMLSPRLADALGQQIVIDNRGGAAGNIGAEMAAKSPPDGYTIVFAYSGTHSINASIYSKMPFKESDFTPIIWLASVPQVVAVHPSLPVKNIRDLIALDKSKPGQLAYGSSGSGAINHLTGELFNSMTGTRLVHVPYKGGGPAAVDVMTGQVPMAFISLPTVMSYVKSGKLRLLAISVSKRSSSVPDVPTMSETLPGFEVNNWLGVLAPAGISPAMVSKLNADMNQA